ncbi:hypothetical protein O9992_26845 [Vibrio lentus]|nr:hypothetical protein [Vibrio lentus]
MHFQARGGSGDISITLTEHQFEVTNRLDDENPDKRLRTANLFWYRPRAH